MSVKYRKFSPQALSSLIPKMVKPVLKNSKNPVSGLVERWQDIVGEEYALLTWPLKVTYPKQSLNGGTLHLEVDPSLALELQHLQPVFLDKLNTYYGYQAIKSLKISQRHMSERLAAMKPKRTLRQRPLTDEEKSKIQQVDDPELREALLRIGRYI